MDGHLDLAADRPLDEETALHVAVDGYTGSLDQLLELARGHRIDLGRLPLLELLDQLRDALRGPQPLNSKGDWVVTATWLVLLRSRLLLPVERAAHATAAAAGTDLREPLRARAEAVALARWLEQRPQLGRDVFVRGGPQESGQGPDIVAFLWASLMVFEHEPAAQSDAASAPPPVYQVIPLDLPSVPEARERLIRLLARAGIVPLRRLLGEPESLSAEADPGRADLHRRGAVASTFTAGLELAKQGLLQVEQAAPFAELVLSLTAG